MGGVVKFILCGDITGRVSDLEELVEVGSTTYTDIIKEYSTEARNTNKNTNK